MSEPAQEQTAAADSKNSAQQSRESGAAQQSRESGAAQQDAADLYGQLLRLKAEFENYRKRMDRERPEWIKMGEAGLLSRLIPVYDTLLLAHNELAKSGDKLPKELSQGLELVFKEFTKVFEMEGVKAIEAVGKPYNHELHEALGSVETGDQPEGTVVEELQKGYTFQSKVLRPARVRIAKKKSN